MLNRRLVAYLLFYTLIVILLFSNVNLTVSNSYQRAGSALFLANALQGDVWKVRSLNELTVLFTQAHEHYKIFSGLADWPPLQLMLLTVSFLLFGANSFSFLLPGLAMTLFALVYLYRLVNEMYPRNAGFVAVVFASLSTFFFYEAGTPMLENTLAAFILMCLYHFLQYLKTWKPKQLYLSAVALGLGFLTKYEMALMAIPILIFFAAKASQKESNVRLKHLFLAAGVFLLVLTPLIARETILVPQGLSTFVSRSVGRADYFTDTSTQLPGLLIAEELEFQNNLSQEKKNLITHRFSLSYAQKFFTLGTALFYNWILAPLILIGIFMRKPLTWANFTLAELLLLCVIVMNSILFGLHGLLPRFVIPTVLLLVVFAVHGLMQLPRKLVSITGIIVVLFLLVQTGVFVARVYEGEHVQSMQHDYESTVQYLLSHQQGNFTVLTTRVYQMAFFTQKHDSEKRVFVELLPEKKELAEQMLKGNFSTPDILQRSGTQFVMRRPSVAFLVVHEKLETGPLRGIADYNLHEFAKTHAKLVATIPESGNQKTWVYRAAMRIE